MRVFLSAGEASGDAYGAALVREMRRAADSDFEGIGGTRMESAGVRLCADSSRWGAISVVQSLKIAPGALGGYYRAKRRLAHGKPGLFVAIDFGYANIRLAKHAKNRGWKVLYFIPPSSWRRDRQGNDLPAITDAISTPFPWSAEILRGMGANAHWFGHPIKQLLREAGVIEERRGEMVGVLPGSRASEIDENLPVIAGAVTDLRVEFAVAPSVDLSRLHTEWERLAPGRDDLFTVGDTYGVLRRSRAAIVCSGTATLEAALCECPMVVVYRVSKTVEWEARLLRFKRPRFIALPNILLDRLAVPELVQEEATPEVVSDWVARLMAGGEVRQAQLDAFGELDALLGPDDAITQTAKLAQSLVR